MNQKEKLDVFEALNRTSALIGRAVHLMKILDENEQAREWLVDVKKYCESDRA